MKSLLWFKTGLNFRDYKDKNYPIPIQSNREDRHVRNNKTISCDLCISTYKMFCDHRKEYEFQRKGQNSEGLHRGGGCLLGVWRVVIE